MTERPTYPKSTCCIPGCQKWSRKFPCEWMCGRHWRQVRPLLRRTLLRLWRRERDLWSFSEPTKEQRQARLRLALCHDRLWARAVRSVTMTEAGL